MRKISLDDVGQVMPDSYYSTFGTPANRVYTVMVIKIDSQALAITFPVSNLDKKRPRNITGNQRKAIRWFMKRNR